MLSDEWRKYCGCPVSHEYGLLGWAISRNALFLHSVEIRLQGLDTETSLVVIMDKSNSRPSANLVLSCLQQE